VKALGERFDDRPVRPRLQLRLFDEVGGYLLGERASGIERRDAIRQQRLLGGHRLAFMCLAIRLDRPAGVRAGPAVDDAARESCAIERHLYGQRLVPVAT
jgi:hypothetical protein